MFRTTGAAVESVIWDYDILAEQLNVIDKITDKHETGAKLEKMDVTPAVVAVVVEKLKS